MGAEISEQDSEKLRKDAFHPGGDAALKGLHKMQKKKKKYLLFMQTGENSPPRTQAGAVGSGV